MRPVTFLSILVLVVSACSSETRYRVSIPNSEKHAYVDIKLSTGGMKTRFQDIAVVYGYRTGVLTDDYKRLVAYATVYAPAVFITYDELSTEWQGDNLVIHTPRYHDFRVDLSDKTLSKDKKSFADVIVRLRAFD